MKRYWPPFLTAFSHNSATHGIHDSEATELGHISDSEIKPLQAKMIPAKLAASELLMRYLVKAYIPTPAHQRWNKENMPKDQGCGKIA
jgi:hypothetical protein